MQAGPLHWYANRGVSRPRPFEAFFQIEPSENPTVRPPPSARLRVSDFGPVPFENGLVVVARTLPGESGLVIVGRVS
jgi:hypothetical protein